MSDKLFGFKISDGESRGKLVSTAGVMYQHWKETEATAGDDDGIGTFKLDTTTQRITKNIPVLSCARQLKVNSNKVGITTKVKVTGTNIFNKNISEEVTLNGTTAVSTDRAFKTIKAIDLPIQTNTPVKQVFTVKVSNAAGTASGTVTTTVTSANVTGSPKTIETEVVKDDTKAEVATKIAESLKETEAIAEVFDITTDEDAIILTNKEFLANDSTLAVAIADTDTTGVGATAAGTATTDGVATDEVIVGWTEKLGLKASARAVHNIISCKADTTDGSVAFTCDADEVEKNMIKFNDSLGTGTRDTCYLVRE